MNNLLKQEGDFRNGALFSADGVYRYRLWRDWGFAQRPHALWIMLNPSTADAEQDDPTIRRCIGFSKAWGYEGLEVVNLFALRATDPQELVGHANPVGPENLACMNALLRTGEFKNTICAWGVRGSLEAQAYNHEGLLSMPQRQDWRIRNLLNSFPDVRAHHLGLTKDGHPRHPLYLRADTQPILWE